MANVAQITLELNDAASSRLKQIGDQGVSQFNRMSLSASELRNDYALLNKQIAELQAEIDRRPFGSSYGVARMRELQDSLQVTKQQAQEFGITLGKSMEAGEASIYGALQPLRQFRTLFAATIGIASFGFWISEWGNIVDYLGKAADRMDHIHTAQNDIIMSSAMQALKQVTQDQTKQLLQPHDQYIGKVYQQGIQLRIKELQTLQQEVRAYQRGSLTGEAYAKALGDIAAKSRELGIQGALAGEAIVGSQVGVLDQIQKQIDAYRSLALVEEQNMASANKKEANSAVKEHQKAMAELQKRMDLLQRFQNQKINIAQEQRRMAASAGAGSVPLMAETGQLVNPVDTQQLQQLQDAVKTIDQLNKQSVQSQAASLTGLDRIYYDVEQEKVKITDEANAAIARDTKLTASQQQEIWDAAAKATQAVDAETQAKIVQQHAQAVKQMESRVDSFINRVIMNAKSFKDVLDQLWTQVLGSFVKMVSNMAVEWLMGMRQMSAASSMSFGGGILGSLFGGAGSSGGGLLSGLLGGGSASGGATIGGVYVPGAMSAFGGASGAIDSLPISTTALSPSLAGSIIAQQSGIPAASGGASSGLLGGLAFGKGASALGLSGQWASAANMGMLAGGLYLGMKALSAGGPISGGLEGMGSGALLGLEFGGPLGALIGGAIGGVAGLLAGVFNRGSQKRKAAGLEQQYEFAADDLFSEFKNYTVDYNSTLQGMQQLIQQGVSAEQALGTHAGQKGAENLTKVIQAEITDLNNLEDKRTANAKLLAGFSVPEFAVGGPVLGAGAVPAVLHEGEYVIRRSAADYLGQTFLSRLNRAPHFDIGGPVGPAAGGRNVTFTGAINLQLAKGMTDQEAMQLFVRGAKLAVTHGAI